MKKVILLLLVLIGVSVICGCIYTPAKVAEETPGVLKNISNDLSTMETPNITIENVLQPLKNSSDYIKPIVNASIGINVRSDVVDGVYKSVPFVSNVS